MTNTDSLPTQTAARYEATADTYGGFVVLLHGTIDGWPYTVKASGLFGTLADAQAEADRLALATEATR